MWRQNRSGEPANTDRTVDDHVREHQHHPVDPAVHPVLAGGW
jgi:hypothetical protein